MVKAYSNDLRQRCVDAMASGEPASKVANRFGVAKSSVIKWHGLFKQTGSVAPIGTGGKPKFVLEPHRDFILEQIHEVCHLTIRSLQAILRERGVDVSTYAIWSFLHREGLSFKKKPVRN